MARLIVEQAAREAGSAGGDATSLSLSHRALSDVSCLSSFSNLERLDLGYNCLVTLEGLSSCVTLKWLSVIENKLVSLKGVEGLSKLQVLNAGKNKLTKMDEVKSLTSLGALILNDNNISSICKLDRLLQLNTLVLSKNPVVTIGDALVKAKSLKKLSLSHCQIESIGSSLATCMELKELRLAHNKITTIPSDLAKNVKILNLDLGNNLIERGSDLKVLSGLRYLRNLNLQGNPTAEKDNLAKKVMKIVPTLRILNAKPMEASSKSGSSRKENVSNKDEDVMFHQDPIKPKTKREKGKQSKQQKENPKEPASQNTPPDARVTTPSKSELLDGKERKKEKAAKERGKKRKSKREGDKPSLNDTDRKAGKKAFNAENEDTEGIDDTNKAFNAENEDTEGIDDTNKPFAELISREDNPEPTKLKEEVQGIAPDGKFVGGLVIDHTKKRKKLKGAIVGSSALELLSAAPEVGAGGLSGWDD